MNHHTLIDNLTVVVGSRLVGRNKFFANSFDSAPIGDVILESDASLDGLHRDGVWEVPVSTPVGDLTFGYDVWRWVGPDVPTVVYHHGNNENPFDDSRFTTHTFGTIFHGHPAEFRANVIAVRAPFHTLSTRDFARQMGTLANFTSMLAGSVAGIEALIRRVHREWTSPVIVSGFSLGGWVSNLHRAYHDTASAYAPMFAGAALDDVFVGSSYHRMVAPTAREQSNRISSVLNFESDTDAARDVTVLGLLGRHDQFIRLEFQRRCYDESDLTIIPKGHVTGSLAGDRLRRHIVNAIERAVDRNGNRLVK